MECLDLSRPPSAPSRQAARRHALPQLRPQREHADRAARPRVGREGGSRVFRVQAPRFVMAPPRRVVIYMAGVGVPQLLGVVEAFLRIQPTVEVADFVVGDRRYYDWAMARDAREPRLRFRYQHEGLDPFSAEVPD